MSNQAKKDQTQELIKDTAKNLFFVKGKFEATTQEIADEAGVNRTLINYYFRSRDNLIQIIFDEAQKVEKEKSEIIMNSDLPLKEKISQFKEVCLQVFSILISKPILFHRSIKETVTKKTSKKMN